MDLFVLSFMADECGSRTCCS